MKKADLLKKKVNSFLVELDFDNIAMKFYARFPNIWPSFDGRTAKDALDKEADLYNENNFGKISFEFIILTSTDEEQFYVQWYVWFPAIAIALRAAKDADAFVIDADLYNAKNTLLIWF